MAIQTRRWDDTETPTDGTRILVCRYRPRGIARSAETWNEWQPDLAPSRALHAWAYGKNRSQASWDAYRRAYLTEMANQRPAIAAVAVRVAAGEAITLLCSSACTRESRCHRSLLSALILEMVEKLTPTLER